MKTLKNGTIRKGQMLFRCAKCAAEIWVSTAATPMRSGLDQAGWKPRLLNTGWHCPAHAEY